MEKDPSLQNTVDLSSTADSENTARSETGDLVDYDDKSMYLNELPDELLEEIFEQLDVTEQLRLRRACRRWHTLFRSTWVLRQIIFTFSESMPRPLRESYHTNCARLAEILQKDIHNVQTVIFKPEQNVLLHDGSRSLRNTTQENYPFIYVTLRDCLGRIGSSQFHRVVFANLIATNQSLCYDWTFPKCVEHLVFRNCTFNDRLSWWYPTQYCDKNAIRDKELVIEIHGEYVLVLPKQSEEETSQQWLNFNGYQLMKKMAEDTARPFSAKEMMEFQKMMRTDDNLVQKCSMFVVENLCEQYGQSSQMTATTKSIQDYDLAQLKPIILRILQIWRTSHIKHFGWNKS